MDLELMTMWLSVDPLADKYPSISPYAYCAWNPVKLVDPDGNDWYIPQGQSTPIYDKNITEKNCPQVQGMLAVPLVGEDNMNMICNIDSKGTQREI